MLLLQENQEAVLNIIQCNKTTKKGLLLFDLRVILALEAGNREISVCIQIYIVNAYIFPADVRTRDHANLLCFLKRLFDARPQGPGN